MMIGLLILLAGQMLPATVRAQTVCNTPGQNPSTAFPVCGTGTFIQSSVNLCGGRVVPSPKCKSFPFDDRNPYYYKFTCFEAGTLGFTITPNNASSDYDWQLFDITGRDPNIIFTDVNSVVCSNWSGNPGNTGTTSTAPNLHECEGFGPPPFSKMPTLVKGNEYLLLVSHFSNTQAGYKLEFKGGTAVITDTTKPAISKLYAHCNATQFALKLNKKMKCSSLEPGGSDWEFANAAIPIISATGVGCSGGFDTDSLILTTASPVAPGIYTIRSKKGSDGNTLLDLCDSPMDEGLSASVQVFAPTASPIDSIRKVSCQPTELEIVMRDFIACSSIAADGSDFVITGPAPVVVAGAAQTACTNGVVKVIKVQLASPIKVAGTYTVAVKTGSDGNTLINECLLQTQVGESKTVLGYDSVAATINYVINSSCDADTVKFSHSGGNGINSWRWTETGTNFTSSTNIFQRIYSTIGAHTITLTVSNGVCKDSSAVVVDLRQVRVKAEFEYPEFACPSDSVRFVDNSTGPIARWFWNFGNGNTSTLQVPPVQFYISAQPITAVPVSLVVTHATGCADTIVHRIQVPNNCYIAVPSGFTPNGDGLNDYLYPINAWKAKNLQFRVYNRFGQLVWETRDWTRKWDGRVNGNPMPTGTYVWMLQYTDENGRLASTRGTTVLIR